MRHLVDGNRMAVYAFSEQALEPIDVFQETKKSGSLIEHAGGTLMLNHQQLNQSSEPQIPLDFKTWLPFSSPHYQISSDPKDYVLVPVIIMPSDLPNRNSVAFPLKELIAFHPSLGQQAYKTWKGKPTYYEHNNQDITKSYGVIADVFLRKLQGFCSDRVWKVLALLAFDRSKHSDTVSKVLSGEFNSYSMGAWIQDYSCSYCNAALGKCNHLDKHTPGQMYELNNKLVFRNCVGIEGFETSIVATPAYISAISDTKTSLATVNL